MPLIPARSLRREYRESFAAPSPDAYETLLWDVMKSDATLFMRADQVEAAWQLLTPVLEAWGSTPPSDFPNYAAGSWGPEAMQGLLAGPEHRWPQPAELVKPGRAEKNARTKRLKMKAGAGRPQRPESPPIQIRTFAHE